MRILRQRVSFLFKLFLFIGKTTIENRPYGYIALSDDRRPFDSSRTIRSILPCEIIEISKKTSYSHFQVKKRNDTKSCTKYVIDFKNEIYRVFQKNPSVRFLECIFARYYRCSAPMAPTSRWTRRWPSWARTGGGSTYLNSIVGDRLQRIFSRRDHRNVPAYFIS